MTADPNRKLKVFLCHSSHDKPAVREIYARLKAEGWIDPWLDEEKLFPGQDWDLEIEKAVEETDAVLVFLSDNSVSKEGYIQKELRFVLNMAEYKPEGTLFILPLRLNDCPLPRRLRSWHYVDHFPEERKEWAYGRLLGSLKMRAKKVGVDVDALLKEKAEQQKEELTEKKRKEQAEKERKEKATREAAQKAERERIAREEEAVEDRKRIAAAKKVFQDRIDKLHHQANTAISLQDWELAQDKLREILVLDAENIEASANLEIVEKKLFEYLGQMERERKEHEAREAAEKVEQDRIAKEKREAEEKAPLEKENRKIIEKKEQLKREAEEEISRQVAAYKEIKQQEKERKLPAFLFGGVALIFLLAYLASITNSSRNSVTPVATMISEIDGMTMVYVPEGEFQMGSEDGENDQKPVHTVYLDAYWIDQTEVTNAMYAQCVTEGECDEPNQSSSYTHDIYYGNSQFNNYPVIYVSWWDANIYCEWANRRLPSEAEWEKAAGWNEETQSQMIYPWGSDLDFTYANYDSNAGDTTAVSSYGKGQSFYGVYDMAGNVWEWINDWYDSEYYASSPFSNPLGPETGTLRVQRGGSWKRDESIIRSVNRFGLQPSDANSSIGFRCAMDAD